MFFTHSLPQPFCGECAVLYFHTSSMARWLPQYDHPAVMSWAAREFCDAAAEIQALLVEIDEFRSMAEIPMHDFSGQFLSRLPRVNVLDEIPRDEATYQGLSSTLIPHTRFPGMRLLEYRTFVGALAYQPCFKNVYYANIFEALHPLERNGDGLFKEARTWSCIIQGEDLLPKDVRWVLASIYNLANEMLRPELDEDTLWSFRPWLQ